MMKKLYTPGQKNLWQGKQTAEADVYFHQVVQLLDLNHPLPESQGIALLGFACDEGVKRNHGRVGASEGPSALRRALASLTYPSNRPFYDCGNIHCENGDLETAQQALGEVVKKLLKNNLHPIIIGGGHEVAWGHYQGIASQPHSDNLGIINFDAHFDMRPLLDNKYATSGTSFLQIAKHRQQLGLNFDYTCIGIQPTANTRGLFDCAKQYNVNYVLADEIYFNANQHCFSVLDDALNRDKMIYLSICLDAISAAYAPGVSAPQVMGLHPWQVIQVMRYLLKTGKVVSLDIAELAPNYDVDHRTEKLAAHLVYEAIAAWR